MKTVSFSEYEAAKYQIIGGVEYKEESNLKEDGRISKTYATEKRGNFYEVTCNGITEFWSDKHSESRYYDGRTREELIAQYEEKLAAFREENNTLNEKLMITQNLAREYLNDMNKNGSMVIQLQMKVADLEGKFSMINAMTTAV